MPYFFLAHASALAFWLSPKPRSFDRQFAHKLIADGQNPCNYMAYLDGISHRPSAIELLGEYERLTPDKANALSRYLGVLPPVHVMVPHGKHPSHSALQIEHQHPASVPINSYIPLSGSIAVTSPELTLLSLVQTLSDIELTVLTGLLCSIFCFDTSSITGQSPRRALTDKQTITEFVAEYQHGSCMPHGSKRLRAALPHVIENAASPAELELGLRMELPKSKGGYGFGRLLHNHPVRTVQGGERYCDFYNKKYGFGIEYHSDSEHGEGSHWKSDARRNNELLGARVGEFVLTSWELNDVQQMDVAAAQIAPRLHCRPFSMTPEAVEKRERLQRGIRNALRLFSKLS